MDTERIRAAKNAQTLDSRLLIMLDNIKDKLKIDTDLEIELSIEEIILILDILNNEIQYIKKILKITVDSIEESRKNYNEIQNYSDKLNGFLDNLKPLFFLLDLIDKFYIFDLIDIFKMFDKSVNNKIKIKLTKEEISRLNGLIESRKMYEVYGNVSGPIPKLTKYYAVDEWKEIRLRKQRIYALSIENENWSSFDEAINMKYEGKFFFDQSTFDSFFDKKRNRFDARKLSRSLQVAPYKKEQYDKGIYRNSILCFDLKEEIEAPCATCEANIAYGGGGAHQIFIDDIKEMQLKNIIVLNKNESERLKRTGYNLTVSDEEWREIEDTFVVHIRSIEQNGYK